MNESSRLARLRLAIAKTRLWLGARSEALLQGLTPAPDAAARIGRVLFWSALVVGGWIGIETVNLPGGWPANLLFGVALAAFIWFSVRLAVALGGRLLALLLRLWTPTGLVALISFGALASLVTLPPLLAALAGLVVAFGLTLCALFSLRRSRHQRQRWVDLPMPLTGLALVLAPLVWLHLPFRGDDPVLALVKVPEHDGQPWNELLVAGPYQVASLHYGSGQERWRREYRSGTAWTSTSVDARDLLGRPSGFGLKLRERWLGYGLDALPLNGQVWYPVEAGGALPLVLVVHGNHDMMNPSDPGYAWLGEHLASRGHVVVSVDQNFINASLFGGVPRENATRGWLLLQHLAAWRAWQAAPAHPLHDRVDLDRVVLIGHSRGGEAVALAAAFNPLARFPEDGRIEFDFGFGIRGVAAIAPVDGQFWPADKATELEGLSYFVVHGGMDGDVSLYMGDRQWARTRPDPERGQFRAGLYIHHANHGQFNTRWGNADTPGLGRLLLNRSGLLSGEDQRRLGLLYLTAFVEHAVGPVRPMPALFCQPELAGRLLAPTVHLARCDDGRRRLLSDFESGIDLDRDPAGGLRFSATDLALWREDDIGFRGRTPRRQTGLFLGWQGAEAAGEATEAEAEARLAPSWQIELSEQAGQALAAAPTEALWLDLSQVDRDPPPALGGSDDDADQQQQGHQGANPAEESSEPDDADEPALRPALRIEIELVDADGNRARLALADYATIPPPLPVRHTRLKSLDRQRYSSPTEPVLQSVAVPLAAFAEAGVDLARLGRIAFHFDPTEPGVLVIERIAVGPLPERPDR